MITGTINKTEVSASQKYHMIGIILEGKMELEMEAKVVRSSSNSQPCLTEEQIEHGSRIEIYKKSLYRLFFQIV